MLIPLAVTSVSKMIFNFDDLPMNPLKLGKLIAFSFLLGVMSGLGTDVVAINNKQVDSSALQAEAQQYIRAMNRAQQDHYRSRGKFVSVVTQLRAKVPAETANYRYKIARQADYSQSVKMTAQSKRPELRSYAGGVFVVKAEGKTTTKAGICETLFPSSAPPGTMKVPNDLGDPLICPMGSHSLPF